MPDSSSECFSYDIKVLAVPGGEGKPVVHFMTPWWDGGELLATHPFQEVEKAPDKRRLVALFTPQAFREAHERYLPEYLSLPYHTTAHWWVQNYIILEESYEKHPDQYAWFIVKVDAWPLKSPDSQE